MTPSAEQWRHLTETLRPDEPMTAVAKTLSRWPDALRCAPSAWRTEAEPRLALCRRLSGVYHHGKGRAHSYLRLHTDGELYTASINSRKTTAEVWHDVHRWFGRELHLPTHIMRHRYSFDGQQLAFQYHSPWSKEDFSALGSFDEEGCLRLTIHNESRGTATPERAYRYLGDSPGIDPEHADVNHESAEVLARRLLGITPALAKAIVAYRDKHGPFADPEQLRSVRGVGQETLDACCHLVTIG